MKKIVTHAKKHKGMSSAVLLSILIHVGLFLIATSLVVFTVMKKKEAPFEAPKSVERPKMKLKKPRVRVKKSSRPKSTARIVTKANRTAMPNIELPAMTGMGDGLGDGFGGGFEMMPELDVSIFGSAQTIGNDFEGSLYNFNRDRYGRLTGMDGDTFLQKLRDFVLSGWDMRILKEYYCLPTKLYTTHFMIPEVPSPMAPQVFGEPDMEGYFFCLHYKGKLSCQEPITFRFWGNGDAYLFIRVGGKEVFLACWEGRKIYLDFWQSTSADSEKYYLANQRMTVGEWITLEPGKPLDMEVVFGEWVGGSMAAMLNVEVQGVEYERNRQGGPILPAFKTAPFTLDLLDEIYPHLPVNETCLTNGPVFSDYGIPTATETGAITTADDSPGIEHAPSSDLPETIRTWTMADGKTFRAEFLTKVQGKVSLKGPRGRTIRIPKEQFSTNDLIYIELASPPDFDISFSKQSETRAYPTACPTSGWALKLPRPKAIQYVFSADVKQSSTGSYDHELQVEYFAIGTELSGDRFILLDRQKTTFIPTRENNRSVRLSGNMVELPDYLIGSDSVGFDRRGKKYSSFLVVVKDSRGKVIAHKTPKKWLFDNYENLKEVPVGKYFNKECKRVRPTRPKTRYY